MIFAKTNLNFKRPPSLFLKKDKANSECMLGKTAHYDPQASSVTLYISGRHPKDVLRSLGHELVHHCQNERGDLAPEKMKTMNKNYAQENDHMRKMEKEAYLMGNMCFRDWEDGLDDKLQYKMQIAERKFLKENKNMSVKISKKDLKKIIGRLLSEQEGGSCPEDLRDEDGNCPDGAGEGEGEGDGAIAEHGDAGCGDKKSTDCSACSTGLGEHTCGELMQEEDGDDDAHDEDPTDKEDLPGGVTDGAVQHSSGRDENDEPKRESRIRTPEQENTLYESRFTQRNTKLFEKLVKQWTK